VRNSKKGKVIARGYHKKFGGDHAEIEAIKQQLPNLIKH
jgi:pyrimidine deaminase RibD-like protein